MSELGHKSETLAARSSRTQLVCNIADRLTLWRGSWLDGYMTTYEIVASRLVGAGNVQEDTRIVDEKTYQSRDFQRALTMFRQMGGTVEVKEHLT